MASNAEAFSSPDSWLDTSLLDWLQGFEEQVIEVETTKEFVEEGDVSPSIHEDQVLSLNKFRHILNATTPRAIEKIVHDDMISIPKSKFGGKVKQCAMYVTENQLFSKLNDIFCNDMYDIFQFPSVSNKEREKMFAKFHTLRCDNSMKKKVLCLLNTQFDERSIVLFYQKLLWNLFELIVKEVVDHFKQEQHSRYAVLTLSERKVLFYIVGYIVHKAKKKCTILNSLKDHETLIESLATKDKKAVHFTDSIDDWCKTLDRGGLKYPTKNMYLLVFEIDTFVAQNAPLNHLGAQSLLKNPLKQKILNNFMVKACWQDVLRDIEYEEDADTVLNFIVDTFLTVKGYACARRARNLLQKDNVQKKKSLRSSLKG